MSDFYAVMAVTLVVAWMIQNTYVGQMDSLGTRNKDRFCYSLIFLILTFFVGLRTEYNDSPLSTKRQKIYV